MTFFQLLPFAAALYALLLALIGLARRTGTLASWWFCAGMTALALDSLFTGFVLRSTSLDAALSWLSLSYVVKAAVPAIWLAFSVTYSRGDARELLARWRLRIALVAGAPIAIALVFRATLLRMVAADAFTGVVRLQFSPAATALNILLLVGVVLILANLEQTFRSAAGTMRWRIKFVVLALAIVFGARAYVPSQAILFSAPDVLLWGVESAALLIGCLFLTVAYARGGWGEIEVYPSRTVVRSSLAGLIAGAYLFVVGVLAQLVKRFGGAEIFQFQSFVVLVGLSGLAVLLLSDRARQKIDTFVSRHFRKAQHDSVQTWSRFSQRLANVKDRSGLSAVSAKLISDTFDVLSVTIWLLDDENSRLLVAASSARGRSDLSAREDVTDTATAAVLTGLRSRTSPFDLEGGGEAWIQELRELNPPAFTHGGNRLCVPLHSAGRVLGAVVLADRVSGVEYSLEELELLRCIGDHMTAALISLELSSEVARARELEAFRTMSAFFVHDLKNAAASLNLTLKNLPLHFDDPAFRDDALRGIGNAARRIDEIIARLSAVRERPELSLARADLNEIVTDALDDVSGLPNVELTQDLQPLPAIRADRDRLQSVVLNLVLNARDAVGTGGRIHVGTESDGRRVVLSVADNGCGMSPEFVRDSLFRPFQSTKRKGLGIGLFQSRWIVQAHGGGMRVTSEVGKGTTFQVNLPAGD